MKTLNKTMTLNPVSSEVDEAMHTSELSESAALALEHATAESMAPKVPSRRHFLIGASLGGVASAAALVTSGTLTPAAEPEVVAAAPSDDSKGYHETEHIRRYYTTTRL